VIYQDVTDQDFIDFFANDVIQNMVLTGRKEEISEIINKMPSNPIANKLFHNKGQLKFTDMAKEWGLDIPSFSNGAAYGDLDNDGDQDLIVNNVNQPSLLYRNNSMQQDTNHHYLKLKLTGAAQNRFAVGARVFAYQNGSVHYREQIPSRGFQSSVDYVLHIGLGAAPVDSLVVLWPGKQLCTVIHQPVLDTTLELQMQDARPWTPVIRTNASQLFTTGNNQVFKTPEEDDYQDVYNERNIPVFLSREGPAYAKADVNGDGLEDIFVGGPAGKSAHLYLQQANGFIEADSSYWKSFAAYEDVAAQFFDADGDGDQDLIIGAGGNNHAAGSKQLELRLYLNDSKGKFSLSSVPLPLNKANTAVIKAYDWDGDGDLDLFVGARSVPAQYGLIPESMLLQNEGGGRFTNQTANLNPAIAKSGMITDACWANITGDAALELVIVGEWMEPTVFGFRDGKFTEISSSLKGRFGWWQSVLAFDADKDGRDELVLGNIGQNFYLQPDSANPVRLWIQDFNENGQVEKILTRTINGKDLPVFTKKELTDQVPALKKQNLRHEQYANRSIQELFDSKLLSKSEQRTFTYSSSVIAWNLGEGKFSVAELPMPIQWSSVNALLAEDINGDGQTDLLLGGNRTALLPQFGRLDASFGHVLLNKGNRSWEYRSGISTGFSYRGVTKGLLSIRTKRKPSILLIPNNDQPKLFEYPFHEK
jgi:hypothetical protein